MIILTKSFKKQLKSLKMEINDVVKGMDRVLNKKIFRKGDALLSNSFIDLKNCLVVKIRVGQKQQARMLAIFIIVKNIKIPFFIVKKNDKRFGSNISLKSKMKSIINEKANKSLDNFYSGEYDKINEEEIIFDKILKSNNIKNIEISKAMKAKELREAIAEAKNRSKVFKSSQKLIKDALS